LHAVVSSVEVAEQAVAGGATVIQVRLKGVATAARAEMGARLRHLPAILVINDDVEAAIRCGADGVHLGQDDHGAERAVEAGLLLGISARSVEEAVDAQVLGAAYVGAGPVWTTPSKTDAGPVIGLGGLGEICSAVAVPVVAIGGVDATNAADCIRAGATGVAVMRSAVDCGAVIDAINAALEVASP
jgi:thiamine-phosphate pyrophosphorylase